MRPEAEDKTERAAVPVEHDLPPLVAPAMVGEGGFLVIAQPRPQDRTVPTAFARTRWRLRKA